MSHSKPVNENYLIAAVATALIENHTLPNGGADSEAVQDIYNNYLGTDTSLRTTRKYLNRLAKEDRLAIDWGCGGGLSHPERGFAIPESQENTDPYEKYQSVQ